MRRGAVAWLAAGLLAAACAGCAHVNPYYDPARAHHTRSGFRNNHLDDFFTGSFLRWQWERWRDGLPKPPASLAELQPVRPDIDWLKQNRSAPSVTWIGHATVLLQVGGLNILTDPIFSERASPFSWLGPKRRIPPALALASHLQQIGFDPATGAIARPPVAESVSGCGGGSCTPESEASPA